MYLATSWCQLPGTYSLVISHLSTAAKVNSSTVLAEKSGNQNQLKCS